MNVWRGAQGGKGAHVQTWTAPVPLREFDAVRQRVTDAVDGCFSRVFSQCPGDMHTPLWPSSACRLYLPRPLLTSNSSPIETKQPYPVAACDAHRRTSHHLAIRVAAADLLFTYAPVADRITASVRHFREGEAARKLGRVDCLRAVCEGVAGAHHTLYVHLSQRAQGLAPPARVQGEKKSQASLHKCTVAPTRGDSSYLVSLALEEPASASQCLGTASKRPHRPVSLTGCNKVTDGERRSSAGEIRSDPAVELRPARKARRAFFIDAGPLCSSSSHLPA